MTDRNVGYLCSSYHAGVFDDLDRFSDNSRFLGVIVRDVLKINVKSVISLFKDDVQAFASSYPPNAQDVCSIMSKR